MTPKITQLDVHNGNGRYNYNVPTNNEHNAQLLDQASRLLIPSGPEQTHDLNFADWNFMCFSHPPQLQDQSEALQLPKSKKFMGSKVALDQAGSKVRMKPSRKS